MVPSRRFEPVQRVAKSREDSAARELGDSKRRMQEQESKLSDLKQYHQEYLDRFSTAAKNGMSASQLQEYRAFMSKLESAIEAQQRVVQERQMECTSRKEEWKQKRVSTQALDKVMERFQTAEQKARDSLEQKESDERSQRPRGGS